MEYQELCDRFPAAPDYLSNMYLIERDYGEVNNRRLSEWLGVSAPAVSQAMGRLKTLGLVEQAPYGAARLSNLGKSFATDTLKRHYLLEHLLVRVLGYPWARADDEAHVLQNHISMDLVNHLDTFLGHPDACPHGNPLPGSPREAELLQAPVLAEAQEGVKAMVLRVSEEGESVAHMLDACQDLGIQPGACFLVLGQEDGKVVLERLSGNPGPVRLALELARHIRYRILP